MDDLTAKTLAATLGISPSQQAALIRLGQTYMEQGRLAQARVVFEGLERLDGRNPYVLGALGSICLQEGKAAEAVEWYDRLLALLPDDVTARVNRGESHLKAGHIPEAAADFEEAIRRDPKARHPSARRARLLAALAHDGLELAREKGIGAVLDAQRRLEAQLRE